MNLVGSQSCATTPIDTDNTEALRADAARSKSILERIPAGRWGKPEDFAGPVVFLPLPRPTTCTAQ